MANPRPDSVYLSYADASEDEGVRARPSGTNQPRPVQAKQVSLGIATAASNKANASSAAPSRGGTGIGNDGSNVGRPSAGAPSTGYQQRPPNNQRQNTGKIRAQPGHPGPSGAPVPPTLAPLASQAQPRAQRSPPHQPSTVSHVLGQNRNPSPQPYPASSNPLPLRQPPVNQSLSPMPHPQQAAARPLQLPTAQQPGLSVAIPSPVHRQAGGGMPAPPRSPYGQQGYPSSGSSPSPRAAFASAPQPVSPISSEETLVGGGSPLGNNEKGGTGSLPSPRPHFITSPSVASFKASEKFEELRADPDNDRMVPALVMRSPVPGSPVSRPGTGKHDWWKRFSMVVHEEERKEANASQVSSGKRRKGAGSEWLSQERGGQRNYRLWVGLLAALIVLAIAGGLTYHFKYGKSSSETEPTTHDFGLGDGDSSTTSDDAASTAVTSATSTVQPSASAVQAGQSLAARWIMGPVDVKDVLAPHVAVVLPTAESNVSSKRHAGTRRLDHLE